MEQDIKIITFRIPKSLWKQASRKLFEAEKSQQGFILEQYQKLAKGEINLSEKEKMAA